RAGARAPRLAQGLLSGRCAAGYGGRTCRTSRQRDAGTTLSKWGRPVNRWLPKLDASLPRLTREGFYFAGVLLFVISGAVAKQLNLLIVLCGLLLGPLVLHLRLVSTTLRSVRVSRRVPQRVFAGEPAYVQVGVENQR